MRNQTNHNQIVMLSTDRLSASEKGETSDDWVGVRFRKQIALFGEWVDPFNPMQTMTLDEEWAQQMLDNFEAMRNGDKADVLPRVAVPINHTTDTQANTGEVVALEIVPGDGLYATLEIRDWMTVMNIEDELVFDVSMGFDWDYIDTKTGTHHGIVLEHVALVNDPYLTGMAGFERTAEQQERDKKYEAELEDWLGEFSRKSAGLVMLSKNKAKELSMKKHKIKLGNGEEVEVVEVENTREFEVTITVKNQDGEDAERTLQPGEKVDVPADQADVVKKQIEDAEESKDEGDGEGENLSKSDTDEGEAETKDAADGETDADKAKLSKSERAELNRLREENAVAKATEAYNTLLSAGKIVPAQKEAFVELHRAAQSQTAKVTLSRDGKKSEFSAADALIELVQAGGKGVQFNQAGSQSGKKADDDVAISKRLSQEQLDGLKAKGITPQRIDELAAKSPEYAAQMAKLAEEK